MQIFETEKVDVQVCIVGPLSTCCYIIINKDTREAIIVDPGYEKKTINKCITDNNIKPVAILLTHGHFDHILEIQDMVSEYDIEVYVGEQERELLEDAQLNLSARFRCSYSYKADNFLNDGDSVELAGVKFIAIYTPGHTSGSYCYYFEDNGFLISGDTLFYCGRGRTDFPTGSEATLVRSIKDKLLVLDEKIKVFPGHGEQTTIGNERNYN